MNAPRTVLVTAGASGIGLAIARAFAGDGARVHVCDVSAGAIAALASSDPALTATTADVADPAAVQRVFEDLVARHGRLDVLVNNTGIAGPTLPVEDITVADWDRSIAVSLSSHFYVTRLAVPLLRASRGAIVNIASTSGLFGCPLRSPYVAAKWALVGLTKTWAMELGPAGVRVNAICPGSVNGPRIERVIASEAAERGVSPEELRRTWLRQTSLRTFVEAEDVAQMALYLCSSAGARISGQAITIDGNTESLSNPQD
jgi:NAD(P)-dependent dehydrogenase (short-subunit alcohol dehydrogenase family)